VEILKDLTEQEYQLWKRHPISQLMFQFLRDKAVDYREGAFGRWEAGIANLNDKSMDEARVRMIFCNEMNALTLSDIKTFYQQQGIIANEQQVGRGSAS